MDRRSRRRRLRKTKGEFRALDWGVCRDLIKLLLMDIGVCVGIYCGQKEEEEIKKDER